MNKQHADQLNVHIKRLRDIYSIDVVYNQKYNAIKSHYNSITIHLKEGYTQTDFEHEFAHLKCLTEEGYIKYLYPVQAHADDRELMILSNTLCDLIYDIYVDTDLYMHNHADKTYFVRKRNIFVKYLDHVDIHLKLPQTYMDRIKKAVMEYIDVLSLIMNDAVSDTKYALQNSIIDQRNHISSYMNEELKMKFEWITLRTLHERKE